MSATTPTPPVVEILAENHWTELTPGEHVMHLYDADNEAVDALVEYVVAGLYAGEAVIVIATEAHRAGLERRLDQQECDFATARQEGRYLAVDAAKTLERFIVADQPDDALFEATVRDLIERVRIPGRRVRAYGEMVALLWGRGLRAATVRLEILWHRLCRDESLALFCAYPSTGLAKDPDFLAPDIHSNHSRVLAGRLVA